MGTNPKEKFFSQEGTNPKELSNFQGIYFQVSCTVLYSPYSTVVAHFSRKNLWARFSRRSEFFFKHKSIQSVLFCTVRTVHNVQYSIYILMVAQKSRWAHKSRTLVVINAEINVAVNYFST